MVKKNIIVLINDNGVITGAYSDLGVPFDVILVERFDTSTNDLLRAHARALEDGGTSVTKMYPADIKQLPEEFQRNVAVKYPYPRDGVINVRENLSDRVQPRRKKAEILPEEPIDEKPIEKVETTCEQHPTYRGLRKPRTGCSRCLMIYNERKFNMQEAVAKPKDRRKR